MATDDLTGPDRQDGLAATHHRTDRPRRRGVVYRARDEAVGRESPQSPMADARTIASAQVLPRGEAAARCRTPTS